MPYLDDIKQHSRFQLAGLCGLALLWALSFPAKGAVFQLSLYLIPITIFWIADTRRLFFSRYQAAFALSVCCIVLPIFSQELWHLLFSDQTIKMDSFEIFWRLSVLPLCLICLIRYLNLSHSTFSLSVGLIILSYAIVAIVIQYFELKSIKPWGERMSGIISNPNPFGAFMALGLIIWLDKLIHTKSLHKALSYIVIIAVIVYCWLAAEARSAWIGGAFAIAALLILNSSTLANRKFSKKNYTLGIAIAVILLTIILLILGDHFSKRIDQLFTAGIRIELWQHYIEQLKPHFLFGQPLSLYEKYQDIAGPHNAYLNILLRAGVIGLLALVGFATWVVYHNIATKSRSSKLSLAISTLLCIYCSFNSELYRSEMSQGIFTFILIYMLAFDEAKANTRDETAH
jgi:O-antigen ligase